MTNRNPHRGRDSGSNHVRLSKLTTTIKAETRQHAGAFGTGGLIEGFLVYGQDDPSCTWDRTKFMAEGRKILVAA